MPGSKPADILRNFERQLAALKFKPHLAQLGLQLPDPKSEIPTRQDKNQYCQKRK